MDILKIYREKLETYKPTDVLIHKVAWLAEVDMTASERIPNTEERRDS